MGYAASTIDCTVTSLKQENGIQRKTHCPRNDKKHIKRFFNGLKQVNIQRKTHSSRSDTKRTKRFLGRLKLSIATDLSQSKAELARK